MTFSLESSIAQEFAPIGAEWYYSEAHVYSNNIGYLMIKSVKDTIISGKECRKLDCDEVCWNPSGFQFIHYSNDSLYYYNPNLNSFQLISAFNSKKGDSWNILIKDYDETIDTISVSVDSTDIININEKSLRQLYVNYHLTDYNSDNVLVQDYSYSSRIIERIGDVLYLFNFPVWTGLMCDMNYSGGLRCYEDSELGLYSTGSVPCTYTWTDIILSDFEFEIYPNPTSNWLEIKNNLNSKLSLSIFNLTGEILIKHNFLGDTRLNISNLRTGFYILCIEQNKKILGYKKIIKN